MACYMVLVQGWPPHLALAPIAQVDPPLMPFRDAGYSQADYGITVQDVVYGVWKAKEEKVVDLENFNLDEYERFERVEHGDFNWITPHFLAFASPQHKPVERVPETSPLYDALPRDAAEVDADTTLPRPFRNVLRHFADRDVGLVVRLNSHLYSPSYFEALGIQHLDMIFEDGTCPPLKTVRKFIRLAHETIVSRKKAIAVHCKAGLGRTGCLIGAYLIYRHAFTADEAIAFMRFMRPGMVVGPQQHWLHINQSTFREWRVEERVEARLRREMAAANGNGNGVPSTPVRAMQKSSSRAGAHAASTPPNRTTASSRTPLSEVDDRNSVHPDDYLPAPTPGQPRKTAARADRHHPYNRTPAVPEEQGPASPERQTEIISVHRSSHGPDSDEEIHLRMRAARRPSASRSPAANRSASHHSTTTTTTVYSFPDADPAHDAENVSPGQKPVSRVVSTPVGTLPKTRTARASAQRPRDAAASGVRKTSGRVGSVGHVPAAAAVRKVSS